MDGGDLSKLVGNGVLGIRREDKNKWERRAPISPCHVRELVKRGVRVIVQPSRIRCHSDAEVELLFGCACASESPFVRAPPRMKAISDYPREIERLGARRASD